MIGVPVTWVAIGGAALLAAGGLQTWRVERLKDDVAAVEKERDAKEALRKASEQARDRESKAATASFEGLQDTCTAGFAAAIGRGQVIERIVQAPAVVNGKRRIIGAGELRATLGQDTAPARTP
jgi:hypothetical protein